MVTTSSKSTQRDSTKSKNMSTKLKRTTLRSIKKLIASTKKKNDKEVEKKVKNTIKEMMQSGELISTASIKVYRGPGLIDEGKNPQELLCNPRYARNKVSLSKQLPKTVTPISCTIRELQDDWKKQYYASAASIYRALHRGGVQVENHDPAASKDPVEHNLVYNHLLSYEALNPTLDPTDVIRQFARESAQQLVENSEGCPLNRAGDVCKFLETGGSVLLSLAVSEQSLLLGALEAKNDGAKTWVPKASAGNDRVQITVVAYLYEFLDIGKQPSKTIWLRGACADTGIFKEGKGHVMIRAEDLEPIFADTATHAWGLRYKTTDDDGDVLM